MFCCYKIAYHNVTANLFNMSDEQKKSPSYNDRGFFVINMYINVINMYIKVSSKMCF